MNPQTAICILWATCALFLTAAFACRAAIVWNNGNETTVLCMVGLFSALCFIISLLAAIHHITHR